jgi:hypothetical protein
MKKIKILSLITTMTVVASASPYVGVQFGENFLKSNATLTGKSRISGSPSFEDVNISNNKSTNVFRYGLLFGYAHQIREKLHLMIEADVSYGKKVTTVNFDTKTLNTTDSHGNETAIIKTKFGFGLMPMVRYEIKEKISGLFGIRFVGNNYNVKAYHTNAPKTGQPDIWPDNIKTESKYIFSIEPTIGAQYDFSDKVSGRLTAGYSFGSSKTVVGNYLNDVTQKDLAVGAQAPTASVSINPKGIVVKAALTYSF